MDFLNAEVKIKTNDEQAKREITSIQSHFKRTIRSMERTATSMKNTVGRSFSSVSSAFGAVGVGIGAVKKAINLFLAPLRKLVKVAGAAAAALTALALAGITAAGRFETFQQRLLTVIGTKKEADRAFRESLKFSIETPFTPSEIVETRTLLESVGVRGTKAVESVAEASAAMGRELRDVASAVISLETEPLRRLGIRLKKDGEAFIFNFKNLMGKTVTITAHGMESAQSTLLSIFSRKFQGGIERMSQTWAGLLSTLKGQITAIRAELGTGILGPAKQVIAEMIQGIENMKPAAREVGKWLGEKLLSAIPSFLAAMDVAKEVAKRLKGAVEERGLGAVIIDALRVGAGFLLDSIALAFKASATFWVGIGDILGNAILGALAKSNIPLVSEPIKKSLVARSLEGKNLRELLEAGKPYGVKEEDFSVKIQRRDQYGKKVGEPTKKLLPYDAIRRVVANAIVEGADNSKLDKIVAEMGGAGVEKAMDRFKENAEDLKSVGKIMVKNFVKGLGEISGSTFDVESLFTEKRLQHEKNINKQIEDRAAKLEKEVSTNKSASDVVEETTTWYDRLKQKASETYDTIRDKAKDASTVIQDKVKQGILLEEERLRALEEANRLQVEAARIREEATDRISQMHSDLQEKSQGYYDFERKVIQEQVKSFTEAIEQAGMMNDSIQQLIDSWEEYQNRIIEIRELQKSDSFFGGLKAFAMQAKDDLLTLGEIGYKLGESLTNNFASSWQAFTEGTKKGKEAFRSFGISILKDLNRIASHQLALQIFSSFGSLFGGPSGSPTPTGSPGNMSPDPGILQSADVGHTGGTVGALSARRKVHPDMFIGASRFHNGGIVGLQSGERPIIAKVGEKITPAGISSDAPTIIINNQSGTKIEKAEPPRRDGDNWVISVVAKDLSSAQSRLRPTVQGIAR